MKKPTLRPLLLLLIFTCLLFSCKRTNKDITGNEDEEGIDQLVASDKLNTVENEKPARSEQKENEFLIEQRSFATTETIYNKSNNSETNAKIELLINGPSIEDTTILDAKASASQSAFAWIIHTENGTIVADKDKYFYIFKLNGKYLEYDNPNKIANWGYYYLDSNVTKIGFDYNNTAFEQLFTVTALNQNQLALTYNTDELVFKPYEIEGVTSNSFIPKTPVSPVIEIINYDSSAASVDTILLNAEKNTNGSSLKTFAIKITSNNTDEFYLNPSEITITGLQETTFNTNPVVLSGADTESFNIEVSIKNSTLSGSFNYTFIIENIDGISEFIELEKILD